MMQPELETREGEKKTKDDGTNDIPRIHVRNKTVELRGRLGKPEKIVEEPPCPSDDSKLVDDHQEEENSKDDDCN